MAGKSDESGPFGAGVFREFFRLGQRGEGQGWCLFQVSKARLENPGIVGGVGLEG